MSSAAGLVTASPLQIALQVPTDSAASPVGGGDFSAALATACMAETEAGVPEGMQSAAALAWLAGFASTTPSAESPDAAVLMADEALRAGNADAIASPDAGDEEGAPASALTLLQQMLQPVVPNPPQDAAAQPADPALVGDDVARQVVALAAQPAAQPGVATRATVLQAGAEAEPATELDGASDAPAATDVRGTAAAVTPMAARTATVASGAGTAPGNQADTREGIPDVRGARASGDSPPSGSVGERLVGALAERVSSRPDGSASAVDSERSTVSGPHLYASTREVVSTTAGQVSTRPDVVHATVGSPRWANELGSRLAMMSVRGQNEGSLTLTPEHLGPLEVRISVGQDTTNVWFGAQNADTRAALADAIPRLREMFAASGLSLGHAGVSHGMPGQEARPGEAFASRGEVVADSVADPLPTRAARVSTSLLDTWA